MRALTSKGGGLVSHCDKIDESEAEIENKSQHQHLNNNHDVDANEGKLKVVLSLQNIFGLCKTFKKVTKQLGFHLTFKTADLQHIIFTTLGENNEVNFDTLFLFVPIFIPDAQSEVMFNDSIKK